MSKNVNLPVYVASDEFFKEMRELGYDKSIELDDLIDLIDEDPFYLEHLHPTTLTATDELSFVSPAVAQWMYTHRPT